MRRPLPHFALVAAVAWAAADARAAEPKELMVLKGHTGEVSCVAFSPDGKLGDQRRRRQGWWAIFDAATAAGNRTR